MNPFAYDFGYGWFWNYAHLIALVPAAALTAIAWKREWPRWLTVLAGAVATWSLVGLLIVQVVVRMNLPLKLPTESFLAQGSGRVLDAGAGSGRSSLMVLLARPESRVVALDLYDGYFGISDNSPDRLYANAEKAGVRERIEAHTGDVREIPFDDDSLDGAVSAFVIDHLSRDGVERSLQEIRRVIRPEGQFLLLVINPDVWINVAYPFFPQHGYFGGEPAPERWRRDLIAAGFEVVEQGTTPGTLYLLGRKPGHGPALTSLR